MVRISLGPVRRQVRDEVVPDSVELTGDAPALTCQAKQDRPGIGGVGYHLDEPAV
ncbi:hypothetical protein [uncultured Microbacterium sp.]|uniref:hypothetical protein n=1 Tax=uncultured Microbacterium sp. TaxID=191216 RepID=UPI0025FD7717|nr:hypothetical protein [uncultured Microbacterium sp.]